MPTGVWPIALRPSSVTILAYGALISEQSARLTFPRLRNFRLARVDGLRRVFAHPHIFLLKEGVVKVNDLRIASLSVEPSKDAFFVAAAFDVDLDDEQRLQFMAREPEYQIETVKFTDLPADSSLPVESQESKSVGVICLAGQDDKLPASLKLPMGMATVWGWPTDSGLLPADVYLRHCLLAVSKAGAAAEESFKGQTFLADRKTTIAQYLRADGDRVMACRPPANLASRFSG
eukprot:6195168-Pleurochrysis_carterae.AAC.3